MAGRVVNTISTMRWRCGLHHGCSTCQSQRRAVLGRDLEPVGRTHIELLAMNSDAGGGIRVGGRQPPPARGNAALEGVNERTSPWQNRADLETAQCATTTETRHWRRPATHLLLRDLPSGSRVRYMLIRQNVLVVTRADGSLSCAYNCTADFIQSGAVIAIVLEGV